MNAVVFDTLILSRKLAAAGMPADQAQGVAAALAETLGEQIVTQRDLRDTEQRLDGRMREVEARIREVEARIREVDSRLGTRIDNLEKHVDGRFRELETNLRAEIRAAEQRQTIRLGGIIAAAIVLLGVLVKLL
jgi:predicted nuclease with TOPRIM domain